MDVQAGSIYKLLVRVQNDANFMEIGVSSLQQARTRSATQLSYTTPGHIPQSSDILPHRYLASHVHWKREAA